MAGMDIDVAAWLTRQRTPQRLITPEEALPGRETPVVDPSLRNEVTGLPLDEVPAGCEIAYFALGCYWGAERVFLGVDGVVNTAVGFMGGYTPNPTYRETCTGKTGHTETVRVVFHPSRVSYDELLRTFWEFHDPTQGFRQHNDIGTQYRSAIFPVNDEQLRTTDSSRDRYQAALTAAGRGAITTEIAPAGKFYYAEAEHQQYLAKNPAGYQCDHRTGVSCSPA